MNVASDKPKTKEKDPLTEATGEASKVNRVAKVVTDGIGGDETLRSFIGDPSNAAKLGKALVDDGILTNTQLSKFVQPGGKGFTDHGRSFVESLFMVRAVGDPAMASKMREVDPSVTSKLDRSWHVVIKAEDNTGIPFHNLLQQLADIGSRAAKVAVAKGKRRATIGDYKTMPVLGEVQPYIPEALVQFDEWLRNTSSADVRKAFATLGRQSMVEEFGAPPPSDATLLASIGITAPWEFGDTDIAKRESGTQQGAMFSASELKERSPGEGAKTSGDESDTGRRGYR